MVPHCKQAFRGYFPARGGARTHPMRIPHRTNSRTGSALNTMRQINGLAIAWSLAACHNPSTCFCSPLDVRGSDVPAGCAMHTGSLDQQGEKLLFCAGQLTAWNPCPNAVICTPSQGCCLALFNGPVLAKTALAPKSFTGAWRHAVEEFNLQVFNKNLLCFIH